MDFRVNGKVLDLGIEKGGSLGEHLAAADEFLEKAGSVITGLALDGETVDPERFGELTERPVSDFALVELFAETSSDYRSKALGLLLDLIGLGAKAVEGEASEWAPLRDNFRQFVANFAGLFAVDELSFIQSLADLVDSVAAEAETRAGAPLPETSRDFISRLGAYDTLFRERLAELAEPIGEMRRMAALYAEEAAELRELPVYLQTGKEDRAMKAVLLFVEIFNKVIRLIPELRRVGIATETLRVDGLELPAFYASFNEILRNLSKALEDKDSILIGDLAEYEVAPRMGAFFASMEEALARC